MYKVFKSTVSTLEKTSLTSLRCFCYIFWLSCSSKMTPSSSIKAEHSLRWTSPSLVRTRIHCKAMLIPISTVTRKEVDEDRKRVRDKEIAYERGTKGVCLLRCLCTEGGSFILESISGLPHRLRETRGRWQRHSSRSRAKGWRIDFGLLNRRRAWLSASVHCWGWCQKGEVLKRLVECGCEREWVQINKTLFSSQEPSSAERVLEKKKWNGTHVNFW